MLMLTATILTTAGSQHVTFGIDTVSQPYTPPAPANFRDWKHSRQKTGRPCVGRNGTVVSLPHAEQLVVVSTRSRPMAAALPAGRAEAGCRGEARTPHPRPLCTGSANPITY